MVRVPGGGVTTVTVPSPTSSGVRLRPGARAERVRTERAERGVPRDRVRRRHHLGAERRAVEEELHADDADVIGRGRGHRHVRTRDARAVRRRRDRHAAAEIDRLLTVTDTGVAVACGRAVAPPPTAYADRSTPRSFIDENGVVVSSDRVRAIELELHAGDRMLSAALADTVVAVPGTVAPPAGASIDSGCRRVGPLDAVSVKNSRARDERDPPLTSVTSARRANSVKLSVTGAASRRPRAGWPTRSSCCDCPSGCARRS